MTDGFSFLLIEIVLRGKIFSFVFMFSYNYFLYVKKTLSICDGPLIYATKDIEYQKA